MFGAVAARRNSEPTLKSAGSELLKTGLLHRQASGADNLRCSKIYGDAGNGTVLAIALNLRNSQQIKSWNTGEVE
jgi:hypothetical protein